MRILHLSLGLPPLRTGGLTRYCIELMNAQANFGYEIALLYPGRFLPGHTRIKAKKLENFTAFEVINPLPVPLTYGVSEPKAFMSPCNNSDAFKSCIKEFKPDVIHIHSFQGIHKEFFCIVKAMDIPMLFTTHDYFPVCPRCTLINCCGENCSGPSAERCSKCCSGKGMTLGKSMLMQSGLYSHLKQSHFVRYAGSRVKREMTGVVVSEGTNGPKAERCEAYADYLDYNREIFNDIDVVASNSSMTEHMYSKYFPNARYSLIPVTHAGLSAVSKPRTSRISNAPVKLAYFGGAKNYKGFASLIEAARYLQLEGIKFELDLYGDDYPSFSDVPEVHSFGRVAPDSMSGILRAHDVVVVPSIFHETCGFVALEALCEHVPVICSDAVGVSGLVSEDFVFKAGDSSDLARKLKLFCGMQNPMVSIPADYPITMDEQVQLLERLYLKMIGR